MKNTKFRKRALLSSVAMLLVALVALGSATFAWFAANPTATAQGIKMSTKASAGIAIASESLLSNISKDSTPNFLAAYKDQTTLRVTAASTAASQTTDSTAKDLQPVAPLITSGTTFTGGALSFGKIAAQGPNTEAAKVTTMGSAAAADYYTEKIYIKTTTTDADAAASVLSLSVAIDQANLSNDVLVGIKVAVTTCEGELVGIWKPTAGDSSKVWNGDTTNNYAKTGEHVTMVDYGGYLTSGASKNLGTAIVANSTVNNTTGAADKFVCVYVYLDGENTGVKSANVPSMTDLANKITVSLSTNQAS